MVTKIPGSNKEKRINKSSHSLAIRICLALFIIILLIVCAGIADAALSNTWSKTYGGSKYDGGSSVIRLSDGYAIVGSTSSYSDGDYDVYLVKTDLSGNRLWSRTYGGTDNDNAFGVIQDGESLIIAGQTRSYGRGGYDFYLLKVYLNGTLAWNKTYGKSSNEYGRSVARVGNNYVIVGSTGTGITDNKVYLVKTDLNGNQIWAKTYGEDCNGNCVIGVTDGGSNQYLVAGTKHPGGEEGIYLLKVDTDGNIVKESIIGSDDKSEEANSVIAIGNDYYVVGTARSASINAYALRADNDLNKVWDRTYGGDIKTEGHSIINTGGGFVIAGNTDPIEGDPYLARISPDGDLIKEYTKNVADVCIIYSLTLASDGDYVIAGHLQEPTGDRETDVYLAKISSSMLNPSPTPTPVPSPSPTATPAASASPTAAPTEEPDTGIGPTDEPGSEPTSNPTMGPTPVPIASVEASTTPTPGAGETVTPAASPVPQAPEGDFSTSSVVIIILLTVIATALAGIVIWLFTHKKK